MTRSAKKSKIFDDIILMILIDMVNLSLARSSSKFNENDIAIFTRPWSSTVNSEVHAVRLRHFESLVQARHSADR
jgi:hypothetical protein